MVSGRNTRVERDSIGMLDVSLDAVFGIQTERAVRLYPLEGQKRFADYPALLNAMLMVKKAAARVNIDTGAIEPAMGEALIDAASDLLTTPRPEAFPIHAFHGGGGISSNMNLNEVLANLANKAGFGAEYGSYAPIHPNDHANLNHSTADCLSTGCHIAARVAFAGLAAEVEGLATDLDRLGADWAPLRKLARTCLQDAVDIGFADYLGGVSASLRFNIERATRDADALREVSIGGNIIGRSEDCEPAFFAAILLALNAALEAAGLPAGLTRTDNLFAASQAHDRLLALGASLDQLARTLIRFAKDLRLMGSGPHGGLGEIRLPAMQPGSSAIPGKVNPTIPEFMVQCGMIAVGHAAAMAMTQDHGEMDYNPWEAVVIVSLLEMIGVLESGVATLRRNCVQGLQPDAARNQDLSTSLLPSLIRLKQLKGYSYSAQVAKDAAGDVDFVRRKVAEAEPR
ncbi:lyase family protein [Pseudomonas sp. GX19020]|uniref:lyase family protein n=1 Tax=Pseudomonas sp. GX19020 TaxID=2942277 RepID=UPI002019BFFC|nr:lyase family protein [Pseudomonas sp. GX19020]MCL4067020.1 lyase family protein [Pseudomonas sp. GX19020]